MTMSGITCELCTCAECSKHNTHGKRGKRRFKDENGRLKHMTLTHGSKAFRKHWADHVVHKRVMTS